LEYQRFGHAAIYRIGRAVPLANGPEQLAARACLVRGRCVGGPRFAVRLVDAGSGSRQRAQSTKLASKALGDDLPHPFAALAGLKLPKP